MRKIVEVPERLYEDVVLYLTEKYEQEENIETALSFLNSYILENQASERAIIKKKELEKLTRQLKDKTVYKEIYELSSRLMFGYYDKKAAGNNRLLWLHEKLKNHKNISSILDLGCFRGEFSIELARQGYKMTGVDVSENNIKHANRIRGSIPVRFMQGFAEDVEKIFTEEKFDAVMLFEILEHVESVEEVLKAVESVIVRGGWVFITVPLYCSEYDYHKSVNKIPLINLFFRKKTSFREHVRKFDEVMANKYFGNKKNYQLELIGRNNMGISYQIS